VEKRGLLQDRLNSELCHMSTDCSFFGGSSGNPACANWWITVPPHVPLLWLFLLLSTFNSFK
jgi:hypothetical protein